MGWLGSGGREVGGGAWGGEEGNDGRKERKMKKEE